MDPVEKPRAPVAQRPWLAPYHVQLRGKADVASCCGNSTWCCVVNCRCAGTRGASMTRSGGTPFPAVGSKQQDSCESRECVAVDNSQFCRVPPPEPPSSQASLWPWSQDPLGSRRVAAWCWRTSPTLPRRLRWAGPQLRFVAPAPLRAASDRVRRRFSGEGFRVGIDSGSKFEG